MSTLELLAELDERIAATPPEDRAGLVVQLAARLAALGATMATVQTPPSQDANLSAKEAAKRLGVSVEYLYKHADEFGAQRIGKRVVFPPQGLTARQQSS